MILLIVLERARLTVTLRCRPSPPCSSSPHRVMSEPHRWRERLSAQIGDKALLFLTMVLTLATT